VLAPYKTRSKPKANQNKKAANRTHKLCEYGHTVSFAFSLIAFPYMLYTLTDNFF